jgi:hypothetical protein
MLCTKNKVGREAEDKNTHRKEEHMLHRFTHGPDNKL